MKNKTIMILTVFFLIIGSVVAFCTSKIQPVRQELDISSINVDEFFPKAEGTFILKDVESGKIFIYNEERAEEERSPNSTFKIMNSLIGLQVKTVKDEYDIKYWDGKTRALPVWNQDHTLGSAMRNSVVWYYQAMARDIGEERMQEWLNRCSYGNRDIHGGIDQFWLNSSLKISPLAQIHFLEGLYKETLPFDKDIMKTVKRMMILQEGDEYTLYGKTGSSGVVDHYSTGWFVGFIIVKGHPYVFATNLDQKEIIAGPVAKKVTIDILKKYKLLTR
ncbi:class D beta-lactamase [Pelosinus sp. sgz500959]|uniref:class D beta-lactamase n=1 Tax=Pelosinus sp. sgz500959 TaxID=3242472 RepID=UPI00366BE362